MATFPLRSVLDRKLLPTLDGLRAVSVLLVIVGHSGVVMPADLGVSAFFVLSGFLITRLLLLEQSATGKISLGQFYFRRTLRIFPAYYAFLALSFAADAVLGKSWSPGMLASAVGYVMNYFNAANGHADSSVAHAWSLAVEEQFYLLWPALFVLVAPRGRRAMIATLVAICAAVLAWRSWLFLGTNVGTAYVYNALDTRFDNLAIGCLLAVLLESERMVRAGELAAKRVWLPLVTVGLLALSRYGISREYHYTLGFTVNAVLVSVLIVQLLQLHATRLWRWLEHPVVRYVGVISYPMYLYHGWAGSAARRLPFLPEAQGWAFAAATVAITIVLATGSYYAIERPFLSLRNRFQLKSAAPRRSTVAVRPPVQAAAVAGD